MASASGFLLDEYRIGVREKVNKAHPFHKGGTYSSYLIMRQIFDTLVDHDTSLNIKPMIAESWKIDREKQIVEFSLSKRRFHDNSIITAQAVVDSLLNSYEYQKVLYPFFKYYGEDFKKNFIVKNETTLRISYAKNELRGFLISLSLAYAGIGKIVNDKIIGSGPYELKEVRNEGASVHLQGFNTLGNNKPKFKKLTYVFRPEIDAVSDVKLGNLNETALLVRDQSVLSDKRVKVAKIFQSDITLMELNMKDGPFKTRKKRNEFKKFWYEHYNHALYGERIRENNLIPQGLIKFSESKKLEQIKSGLQKKTLGEVLIGSTRQKEVDIINKVSENLKKQGQDFIQIKGIHRPKSINLIKLVEKNELHGRILTDSSKLYDLRTILTAFHTKSPYNINGIDDRELDQILDRLKQPKDSQEIDSLLKDANKHIVDKVYAISLAELQNYRVFNKNCEDVVCETTMTSWSYQHVY